MPTPLTSERSPRREFASRFSPNVLESFHPLATAVAFTIALASASCDRPSAHVPAEKPKPLASEKTSPSPKEDTGKKLRHEEGYAVWYVVPPDSLAKRRAGKDELTAAHNRLRLGTMVRVTHLAHGQSVIVRITDRGITKRGASIDLCKEAAEKLGMISEGMARVRIEELPDDKGIDAAPDPKAAAAHP